MSAAKKRASTKARRLKPAVSKGSVRAKGTIKATGTAKAVRTPGIRTASRAKTPRPPAPPPSPAQPPARKSPAVERPRRTWDEKDESVVQGPPSSLDLDRTASSARSGRRELLERHAQHTETGPTLTGGDVDANWESAYSVGDEAPGGDSPTPDQDLVDDIGKAVGLVYEDNEELEGEAKVTERDRHRWELDPASSDDFDDR